MIDDDVLTRAIRMTGGEAPTLSWLREFFAVLVELGYELLPDACPTCDRYLALSCAVCGQVDV